MPAWAWGQAAPGQPVNPSQGTKASPPASQPAGPVSPSDPVDAGSQPASPNGTLGTTTPAQSATTADAQSSDDIVVTGFRSSLQTGINLKREAITIRDSIVAEDIGKFPDANIAESLQRIPGVELVRDGASNEGQTIRLRGLPQEFTVTTFNGAQVYTTSTGGVGNAARTFNYDVFPSELFGRVDVYKAPLAELTEGGIAGVVDLQTPRPFDQKQDFTARYQAALNYNTTSHQKDPRGNILLSAKSGNFGALLAVAGARSTNARSGFQSTGTFASSTPSVAEQTAGIAIGPLAGASNRTAIDSTGATVSQNQGVNFNYNFGVPGINLNGATERQVRDALLPRFIAVQVGRNVRKRIGGAASLQYKSDHVDISLDGLYSRVKDNNQDNQLRWPIRDSFNAPVTPTAINQLALVPVNVRIDANNNLQGTLGNVQFQPTYGFSRAETKFKYLALNGAFDVTDSFKVSGQAAVTDSFAFRNGASLTLDARGNGHQITFDTTNAVFPNVSTNRNLLDPTVYYATVASGPAYTGDYREESDKLKSGRLIADWNFGLGAIKTHLKAGFTYNQNKKILQVRSTNNLLNSLTIPGVGLYGAATTTLAQRNAFITSFLTPFNVGQFSPGAPKNIPQDFLAFDQNFIYGTLNVLDVNRAAPFNLGSTYTATETIKGAFIQADFETEVFGKRLRANAGVRYVDTSVLINNNRLGVGTGVFNPNVSKGSYDKFLPSVTVALDLLRNVVVRAAYGKTFTRAPIQSIAADISLPAGGAGNLILNAGNPDLKPQFATSLDGIAEWYFAKGGILSFAAYRKTLTGRPVTFSVFRPFNQLGIPASIFATNIQATLAADPTALVEVRTPVNLSKYKLNGLEVAYQQAFTFLPKPFDGFGLLASATRVNTSGLTREFPFQKITLALNDVPKYTFQVGAYYEKGPVSLRTTYNYRSNVATIGATNDNTLGFQRYQNARGFLDATVSYRFAKWLEVRIDGSNLTNTKTFEYFKDLQGLYGDEQSRLEGALQNGRAITVGIRGAF